MCTGEQHIWHSTRWWYPKPVQLCRTASTGTGEMNCVCYWLTIIDEESWQILALLIVKLCVLNFSYHNDIIRMLLIVVPYKHCIYSLRVKTLFSYLYTLSLVHNMIQALWVSWVSQEKSFSWSNTTNFFVTSKNSIVWLVENWKCYACYNGV